jgi:hypothetical protein
MQMGRGMIKGVSAPLFKQFATAARQQIQASTSAEGAGAAVAPPAAQQPLFVAPLVGRTVWQAIVDFFRRLFGRASR